MLKIKGEFNSERIMPNPSYPPTFDQYHGENKFILDGITYEQKKWLGRGLTANVYRFDPVSSISTSQSVAVKVEQRNRGTYRYEEGEPLFTEACWNSRIHGRGVFSGNPKNKMQPHYVLMAYFEGISGKDIKFQNTREIIEWFLIVASFIHEKMHAIHHAVHGDIKTDNIIFQSSKKMACVIDFGLTAHFGEKVGAYAALETKDPIFGKKLTTNITCPQTAPELFGRPELEGRDMVPAHPSQDAYALGQLLLSFLEAGSCVTEKDKAEVCGVVAGLRATLPEQRWLIPAAISKLHVSFIAVVTRPMANQQTHDNFLFKNPLTKAEANKELKQSANASDAITKGSKAVAQRNVSGQPSVWCNFYRLYNYKAGKNSNNANINQPPNAKSR